MAGREARGAELLGQREHLAEADQPVAADARVRRAARLVLGDEVVDDRAPELVAEVERDVGNPHRVSQGTSTGDGLRRAARLRAIARRIRPQLERDGKHVVTGVEGKLGRNRRVNATRHGDQSAPSGICAAYMAVKMTFGGLCGGSERSVERVGGQGDGVLRGGRQSSELAVDLGRADPAGVDERARLDQLDDSGARRNDSGAARRIESSLLDDTVLYAHRDAYEVAARRAPGRSLEPSIG